MSTEVRSKFTHKPYLPNTLEKTSKVGPLDGSAYTSNAEIDPITYRPQSPVSSPVKPANFPPSEFKAKFVQPPKV